MSLALKYRMKKMAKGGEFKDKSNPDASDQVKASARAKRNSRGIKTPEGEYKRYFKFLAKEGAMPGKKGEKVYGSPKDSYKETGVHSGGKDDNTLRGRSAAGVSAEWAGKHEAKGNSGFAEHARQKAKEIHSNKLDELKSMSGPTSGKSGFAEGGQVCMYCGGMGYSEGGEVANTDLPEADFMPNEFDVLHLEDDLESSNTGENSGDYDGDDVVKRVMAKRKK